MANVTTIAMLGRAVTETPLLLPDGRDARTLDLFELTKALAGVVPDLDQGAGKTIMLEKFGAVLWAGLLAKLTPAEKALVLGK